MVFHNTNFVMPNAWWIRRVRPLWMGAIGITVTYLVYRYHFWGKWAAQRHEKMTQQQLEEWAARNKR